MKIVKTSCDFFREPLIKPFGFKGGYMTEIWRTAATAESACGARAEGIGTQSVLWSDAGVFAAHPESAGNAMMFLMTRKALKFAEQTESDDPLGLLENILHDTREYGKIITGNENLRKTFALNSLVAPDSAAWALYKKINGYKNFDEVLPKTYRTLLPHRHAKLANIPLISYDVGLDEITGLAALGFFLFKIKIGSDPDKDGDVKKMLEWDKRRIAEIHAALKNFKTPHTESGRAAYYLDANGRYPNKELLAELLVFMDETGALERTVLLEEPFPEENEDDVSDLPVRIAADESAHSDEDALRRIARGYGAIALKPVAKTLSMSLKILAAACFRNVPCFCADLTVGPFAAEWNKNVAARLAPLPGIKIGVMESNGHQNYKNWEAMKARHPCAGAAWIDGSRGFFELDDEFYIQSGGIFSEI